MTRPLGTCSFSILAELDRTTTLTSRKAITSFVAGLLTMVAICLAVIPVPLTGLVCFPAAAVLGAVAIVTGMKAMRETRSAGGRGKTLAVLGLAMGGAALLAALCGALVAVTVWPRLAEAIRLLAH